METLTALAQLLQSSTREVMGRVGLLREEVDHLKEELEKVKGQLVEAKATELLGQGEAFGEFRLLAKELPEFSAEGLKRMASTLVKKDPYLVVILGSAVEKPCVIGAAGQKAVEKGINMAETIKEAARIIEGGGGGTAKIAQAGGRETSQLGKALHQYAEDVSRSLRTLLQ